MIRKRTIGTLAALGGLTATVALLSGLPSAKADELADLRANQQLLQQRLDQLAQIPTSGGLYPGGPPPQSAGSGMVGGSFPRSFLVPGTDTSIRVGGRARWTANYWFSGGNPQNSNDTAPGNNGSALVLPLNQHNTCATAPGSVLCLPGNSVVPASNFNRSRGVGVFGMTPRESSVNFETRTPTAWGEARTFISFDFNNDVATATKHVSSNLAPRLLYAYGTMGGILVGQANSNFSDSDAGSETLDYGGNIGGQGVVRLAQVRYTLPLAGWGLPGAWSVSAEVPETDFWAPAPGAVGSGNNPASYPGKSGSPDFTMAWYIPQPWGHMDYAAVVRPMLQIKDGLFVDKTYAGFGFAMGGDVKPRWFGWDRDNFTFRTVGGWGIGRYVNSTSSLALVTNFPNAATPVTAAQAALVSVKPITLFGGDVGYQHHWLPNLRSTASMGFWHQDVSTGPRVINANGTLGAASAVCPFRTTTSLSGGAGCGALNKEIMTAHFNLIWAPVPFIDLGIEYVWAHRVTVSNLKGDENVLLTRMAVNF